MLTYTIHRAPKVDGQGPGKQGDFGGSAWDAEPWKSAETLEVARFHPRSSSTHPTTRCKVYYDDAELHWSFKVDDRFVRAGQLEYQGPVCRDSCVEFFVKTARSPGYFNFEVNCIGTLLLMYIEDPARTATGFVKATPVPLQYVAPIRIWTSLRERPYLPENRGPVEWRVDVALPFAFFGKFDPGFRPPRPGDEWRGNFFKCADDSSRPHWASWAPIGEELNFHVPEHFGLLRFGRD